MAEIKFTKNSLRSEEHCLGQFERYLPTLQLKKSLLQVEVDQARLEIIAQHHKLKQANSLVARWSSLTQVPLLFDLNDGAKIARIGKNFENIAGVEIPLLESLSFEPVTYPLFDTPVWIEGALEQLREVKRCEVTLALAQEKGKALEEELRAVSIRVNLFEKVLIPRAKGNIKKIKVFLGDQELAAVGQAKVAKQKISEKKESSPLFLQAGEIG